MMMMILNEESGGAGSALVFMIKQFEPLLLMKRLSRVHACQRKWECEVLTAGSYQIHHQFQSHFSLITACAPRLNDTVY
jgi:hypothetical protein